MLAACGDPVADIARLSDQDIPENPAMVEVVASPEAEGVSLLERLLAGGQSDISEAEEPPIEPAEAQNETADEMEITAQPDVVTEDEGAAVSVPPKEKAGGLLAFLKRAAPPKEDVATDSAETEAVTVALEQNVDTAIPELETLPATPEPAEQQKLFSLFGTASTKPETAPPEPISEIEPGTLLPYGQVARICGLPKRAFGKKVAQYPEKRAKHRIYDSDPGNTAPHSFFITGFEDGCARQFTASMAMFGSVSMHEQLRYGLPAEVQPYSDTDRAYEKLKSRVCRVPRNKPCGARVKQLEGNTVFVSIYERFGSNSRWNNLLLHDGEVFAQDSKGG